MHELIPWAGHVNYAASKGGVMLMMKSIAQQVAPYRIRVNRIAPGAIRTPINMHAWDTPEHYAELLKLIPYMRICEAEEIGRAAVWLASDDSNYVHGVTALYRWRHDALSGIRNRRLAVMEIPLILVSGRARLDYAQDWEIKPPRGQWTEIDIASLPMSSSEQEPFEARGCLFDVIDCDHQHGVLDASLRPNQIFAVGGLPLSLLEEEPARAVVDVVQASLLTPKGLRSLGPDEPGYRAHYEGGVVQRDGSYHQGTVWPWLIGPFVEAWLRVRGNSPSAKQEARNRFLPPLYEHLNEAGLGHVSEITDAQAPYTPRGCPFQAWSLGELLRLDQTVLSDASK